MYYEINVALNGKHYFATHKRSITTEHQLQDIVLTFATKFPEEEGYEISISLDKQERYMVDFHEVRAEAIAENKSKLTEHRQRLEDKKREAHQEFILAHPQWEE